MRRLSVATIVFLLLAGSAFSQKPVSLKYNFAAGDVYRYADTLVVQTTQEMMGQEMKVSQNISVVTRFVVDAVISGGGASLITSNDTMLVKVKNPRVDTTIVPVEILHKRNRLTVTPLGDITAREVIDSVRVPMLMRGGGIGSREIMRLPVLSANPVKPGEKWTSSKVDSTSAEGGSSVLSMTMEYTFVGREKYAGRACVKLAYTGKLEVNSKSKMGGMDVFTEGTGKLTGVVYFDDRAGVFVADEGKTDMEMTAALTGQQNMTIPISSTTTMKHVLLAN